MSVKYTDEQLEVINLRDCNILVSAAAGSGKTAVLTERIVKMVSDEERPVDIDRLLVVTFTNAAAAEMRERIGNKLSDRLAENPASEHLQRQLTLLHAAQITTIDSFCLFLLKNHFQEIGLDPAFRVADEREIKLMQQEALSEVLEEVFEEGREEFRTAVEVFCPSGNEKVLEDHVLNLAGFAASYPWPEEWLLARKEDYALESESDLKDSPIWKYFEAYVKGVLKGCVQKLTQCVWLAQLPDGPYTYGELLDREKEMAERLLDYVTENGLEGLEERLSAVTFGRLSSKKDDGIDPAKREQAQKLREDAKKAIAELTEQFFATPFSVTKDRSKACRENICELIDLVLKYEERMAEKKREKKLIDFSDMEHFALNILLRREGEKIVPTQVAMQYREYFHEILIDEYQDSNLVQEYFLRALSGEEDGRFDRFMVGDVKQSIYHFRLARPELFLEKYRDYGREGPLRKIDLSKNFRSRREVTETVNRVFERTMSSEVGGIVYDDDAALHAGATFPENEIGGSELILVEKPKKGGEFDQREAEALAIAERIRRLRKDNRIMDSQTGEMRPVQYRDVVILLRSLTGWGDAFKAALESQGIPAYVTSKSGYFTATEVQEVLNFLRIIDNPLQDVPLFGVMHSCFGGFTETEIARIRGEKREKSLYECLLESEEPKATDFLERLSGYRETTSYLTIRTLIEKIIWDYDYLNYVTALPGGSKRRANLEMLLVKASDFEKTSYFGLFHFLRYVDMLEKYEEDYGEADTLDENADVVRIMSIHKSKGLEFPVTIVAGVSKSFNMQDVNKSVIMEVDLGIGMDYVDPVKRMKGKTLRKNLIAKKLREDTLSEELRLLYVAMTRAKEKLILTALADEPEKTLEGMSFARGESARLTYLEFMKATSCLDFLLPVLKETGIEISTVPLDNLRAGMIKEKMETEFSLAALENVDELADQATVERLRENFEFRYPHAELENLYVKTTVSELKIAAMSEKDEAAFHAFEENEEEAYVPEFRRTERRVSGTVRGDAYHRVMELLDYGKVLGEILAPVPETYEEYERILAAAELSKRVETFLRERVEERRLSQEYFDAVRAEKICEFIRAEIGYRIWKAERSGKLWREQPFFLTVPATRLKAEFPETENVLIQGIIDLYFEEDGKIVLLDYKTDRVASLEELWNRYETQIEYYQEALERLTGKDVKEKILYSFSLGHY